MRLHHVAVLLFVSLLLVACSERVGFASRLLPDLDGDFIPDDTDNCPAVANTPQLDTDLDGLGDACDPDDDNDEVLDEADNCRLVFNPDQLDSDLAIGMGDGVGNACDNCPLNLNPGQQDSDIDGIGDLCDDQDADGFMDLYDNCPGNPNPDQTDTDGDTVGDMCDNCPNLYNPSQRVQDPDACV